ncbi:MAG: 50S ribosomal protein L19 [Chlamydiales bacterium]|nr:50S ribosomal protein L19 [Chlamydiales bacterium]
MDALIEDFESEQLKQEIPEFHIGDTIRVSTKIIEGEKERIQVFQGTVIARKGRGLSETFSLHRVSYGEGMERVFYLHSPRIVKIQVVKQGDVRRAKLYDLRGKTGKAAKIKEKIGVRKSRKAAEVKQERINETEFTESEERVEYEVAEQEPVETTTPE